MKVYHAVALATLATPLVAQAGPMPRMPSPIARSVVPVGPVGPVMGTTVFPGGTPGGPPVTPIGPINGTIINPGSGGLPIGPVHGTIINPGGGLPGTGNHHTPPSNDSNESGGH
jgi:hypothetical protein